MTDTRKAGIVMLCGTFGGMLTMAIHPTSASPNLAPISGLAHAIAMFSTWLLFLGACGLAQRLAASDRLAFAGTAAFGFASVAVLIATAISGFVMPAILGSMDHNIPFAIFQINQAFSKIYSVGVSLAVSLWSLAALRHGGLQRALAIYGFAMAALVTLAIASGHLRLNVHGMAIVVVCQAIWFIGAGFELYRA